LQGFQNETALTKAFSVYGPVKECHIAKNKATGHTKGFAFLEFYHSVSASDAYKALDDQDTHLGKLAVAFSNPAKVCVACVYR
jgi:RNA recognition motif-containing protein